MSKIKLREFKNKSIRTLNKRNIASSKYKENIINPKEKDNESSISEYGSNKIEYVGNYAAKRFVNRSKKLGNKSVLATKNNMIKLKNKVKLLKEKLAKKRTIKKSSKVAVKGATKASKKVVKETVKAPKKIVNNLKRLVKTTRAVIKVTIKTIKAVITGAKAIISALIAGGWIVVVIIIVICVIALLLNSVFGIFLSSENTGDKTMSSVISNLDNELAEKITTIQNDNPHDDYVLNLNRTGWKYILSIYTVIVANGDNATDVITVNENKANILKDVFWKMNIVTYNIREEQDEFGNIKKILYINIDGKTVNDMITEYNLTTIQQSQLSELLSNKYESMWTKVVYGSGVGNSNVVDIALSQVGNIGGEPYWRWYGFNSRIEWCAVFVSWVYNQAGYLNIAVPKFSTCHTQGVPWFKTFGLWREKGYVPKSGDIIFFDWEQDGHTDHVGIVEKSDGKDIYTVEGNSRDAVKKKKYSINSKYIYGFGIPKY